MSYYLLVFDPQIAPRDRADFMTWFDNLTKWEEQRDYDSPNGMTGNLPTFFERLRQEFPAMNGPFAIDFNQTEPKPPSFWQKLFGAKQPPDPESFDADMITDYCLAENAIYMAFSWYVSDQAYNCVFNTAYSTGVGFFNPSAENGVILHDPGQFEDLLGL